MEEYVTISLERYECMRDSISTKINVIKLQDKAVKDLNNQLKEVKELLLNEYILSWKFQNNSIEELTDIAGFNFAFANEDKLLKVGFEEQELIDFIKKKYKEWKENNYGN